MSVVSEQRSLATRLRRALRSGTDLDALAGADPSGWRDALLALDEIHALHTAPLEVLAGGEWHQHHPAVAGLKGRLEAQVVARLDIEVESVRAEPEETVAAIRAIAAEDLVPDVYEWVAHEAPAPAVREFLAIEGGPDGGFDDLVALGQVGLTGLAKVTLGENYWDEMGRGSLPQVHTELHRRLVDALRLRTYPAAELPTEVLERAALTGLLATNRAYQPEMIGALGLLELQAGPRCRRVLSALRRVDVPDAAMAFYEVHADTDPRHGKAWLDDAVCPIVEHAPAWGPRIVRGARWRAAVNGRLFDALDDRLRDVPAASAA